MGAYGSPELLPPEREKRKGKGAVRKFFKVLLQLILGVALGLLIFGIIVIFLIYGKK